jgi:hypothetical protein
MFQGEGANTTVHCLLHEHDRDLCAKSNRHESISFRLTGTVSSLAVCVTEAAQYVTDEVSAARPSRTSSATSGKKPA